MSGGNNPAAHRSNATRKETKLEAINDCEPFLVEKKNTRKVIEKKAIIIKVPYHPPNILSFTSLTKLR